MSGDVPKTVIRISQIVEDISVIVAVWGPGQSDTRYARTVRGVPVNRTCVTKDHAGRAYRMHVFPDYSWRWVNEGNVRWQKVLKPAQENF